MSLHSHPELALALPHHRAGRTAQAEQIYRRIQNAEPLFAEPYFHLGNLLQALGRVNEAAESFQRLVQLEPQMAQALLKL